MNFIDTHSHLFLEEFAEDLPLVMQRAKAAGVSRIYMPNIDCSTIKPLLDTVASYPDYCYPMIGLHPTSVNESFKDELGAMLQVPLLEKGNVLHPGNQDFDWWSTPDFFCWVKLL